MKMNKDLDEIISDSTFPRAPNLWVHLHPQFSCPVPKLYLYLHPRYLVQFGASGHLSIYIVFKHNSQ